MLSRAKVYNDTKVESLLFLVSLYVNHSGWPTYKYSYFVCFCLFFIVAFAAVSAFVTEDDQFPGIGELIVFQEVFTDVGATPSFNGSTFTCPATAFYFVYHRLNIRSTGDSLCRVNLVVGDDIRQVSFNMHFYSKAWKFCYKCFIGQAAAVFLIQPFALAGQASRLFFRHCERSGDCAMHARRHDLSAEW